MKGILTDNLNADSDCIVTAVFLGLSLQSGKGLQISVDDAEKDTKLAPLEATMAKVNTALKSLNPKHTNVKAGVAPAWAKGTYITGGLKTVLNMDTIRDFTENGKVVEQYEGIGAYTGMVIVKNELKYWGSTFEHTCKTGRKFGKSIGPDLANMQREAKGNGINGYVHGMVQAIYAAAHFNSIATAKVVEVAVGTKTTKLASCFGCTTFMLANLRQPSAIHLGRAESWAPADPNSEFALKQLTGDRCTNDMKGKPAEMKKDVERLNKAWREQVAGWLSKGAELSSDLIAESHKPSWEKLQKKYKGNQMNVAADDFLDALGAYHGHDLTRINNTLADPKK